MTNNFLEKLHQKYDGETISKTFSKKSKLSISLDQQSNVLYSLFFILCQFEDYQNVLKLSCSPLAFTSNEAFLRNETTTLSNSFSA